jgi:exodeoxyribonuclease V beta subunit
MPKRAVPVAFHDPDEDDERKIDVGLQGREYSLHRKQHEAEQLGEDLRLAYVALTRARHQAVVWWAPTFQSRESSLARLLFANDGSGDVPDRLDKPPGDDDAVARLEELAASVPGRISVERVAPPGPAYWSPPLEAAGALDVSSFDRRLDWGWRRTSYSDITAGGHDARVASEPEEPVLADEPDDNAPLASAARAGDELRTVPSPLAEMPVGVQVGTFVHGVFEAADFAAPDLDAELAARVAAELSRRRVDVGDVGTTVAGLRAAIETPLGPLAGGRRLRDVARADRLDELAFELPLAGGDDPSGRFTLAALRQLLLSGTEEGDPLRAYAERLIDPSLRRDVRGYLTGSIDVVLRVPGDDGTPRFAIADYKTNWLAPPGEALSAGHHLPPALAEEMERRHYWLQALLYTVALHRYLRWRLPDYDPERHLGGVLYLFVRGMVGSDTPVVDGVPCGVFGWRPAGALVEALSDVLDGRGAP